MKQPVIALDGGKAGDIELADSVFGIEEIRVDIVHRAAVWQLARRRAGTHSTLSRSQVRARHGKSSPQKRGGRARHGARSAPIFVGGGVAHGPKPRSHAIGLQKKVRRMALQHALSAKARDGTLIVLDKAEIDPPKTGALRRRLTALGIEHALIVAGEAPDAGFTRAAANIANIDVLPLAGLNVYDVVRRRALVLTREAVAGVHARFLGTAEPAT